MKYQEQPDCHTVEEWMQHIKNIDAEKLYKQVDSLMARYAEYEKEFEVDDEELSIFYQGKRKMCSELLGIIDSLQQEQPEDGLEEEITRYLREECSSDDEPSVSEIARHFAEWGEKNAYKAIMKKADEVRDKRFDTDYEVKIEPAAGFDWGCVNIYHEGLNTRKED